MCSLSVPVLGIEEQDATNSETLEIIPQEEVTVLTQDSTNTLDEELPPQFKTPYSKKKLAKKFIIAMLCVAGCSIFLYGTLTVYNKIRDGILSSEQTPPEGEKPLDTPSDLTEAIKTFMDKTMWKG